MTNWKPSDAEVDAACKAHACGLYPGIDIDFDQVEGDPRDTKLWPAMTAALIAAHDAAPEPDTTGFEAAVEAMLDIQESLTALEIRTTHTGSDAIADKAYDKAEELADAYQRLIDMYKERR